MLMGISRLSIACCIAMSIASTGFADDVVISGYDLQGVPASAVTPAPFEFTVRVYQVSAGEFEGTAPRSSALDLDRRAPLRTLPQSKGGKITKTITDLQGPVLLVFTRVGQGELPTAAAQIVLGNDSARHHELHVVIPATQDTRDCAMPCGSPSPC